MVNAKIARDSGASVCKVGACHRPIVVLSDDDREGERRFEPPSVIHESVWGPPIYIAYLNSSHYEATAPLAKPGEGPTKKTTIRIKHEKVS